MLYRTVYIVLCMLMSIMTYSQTANITSGCAELKVDFTSPDASSYYWDFGDTNSSSLQNPTHSYIQPGEYVVKLFDVQGGTQIGNDIQIKVFPEIQISANADVREGCAPLTVNFSSQIQIDPELEIDSIIWTFGNGASLSGQNVTYTYLLAGEFNVSVKVITKNDIKCDAPLILEKFIDVEGPRTNFRSDKEIACDVPAEFTFVNTTPDRNDFEFLWEFGDNTTSQEINSVTHTFQNEGLYEVSLTATSPRGCSVTKTRKINIGSPNITTEIEDTVCLESSVLLGNTTLADSFVWNFTLADINLEFDDFDPLVKSPTVSFDSSGIQQIILTAIAEDGCETTDTLSVFVEIPNSEYTLGPDIACADMVNIEYTAQNPNHIRYQFITDIREPNSFNVFTEPTGSVLYEQPEREAYYINYADSIITRLIVTSIHGCESETDLAFHFQKAEAFFTPSQVAGCVPFDITFFDKTFAEGTVISREWDFDDGTTLNLGNNDTIVQHTYTEPGEYEVTLKITDEFGCEDVSRPVQILVLDKPEPQGGTTGLPGDIPPGVPPLPNDSQPFCLGEEFSFPTGVVDSLTLLHFEGDSGRLNHCPLSINSIHSFLDTGTYVTSFILETAGILMDSITLQRTYDIVGTKAQLSCEMNCEKPYEVDFNGHQSLYADKYEWYLEDSLVSSEIEFQYTFKEEGDYKIVLQTYDEESDCAHKDSTIIYIRDLQAKIAIPDKICAQAPFLLDATQSKSVQNSCVAGYRWDFDLQRPREVATDTISHTFQPGRQNIMLTVTDINGCTDTDEVTIEAFCINAEFISDSLICLPSSPILENISSADTTIVSYEWNFGNGSSTELQPNYEFTEADISDIFEADTIQVLLSIEDVLGCTSEYEHFFTLYEIPSRIFLDNGPVICEDEIINFRADDFTAGGSSLNFEWDFGNLGIENGQNISVEFSESGDIPFTMTYTEKATGCQGKIDSTIFVKMNPQAGFSTEFDEQETICAGDQVQFTNETISEDMMLYKWTFQRGEPSTLENPRVEFTKGTFEVSLVATTFFGCMDTFTRSYTFVEPEGDILVDDDMICPGEEITLTLINAEDVESFTWDLGDGTQIDNVNPIMHTYGQESIGGMFTPAIILRSEGLGCERSLNLPINISSLTADFQATQGNCPGEVQLSSDFNNPESLRWEIGNQVIENDPNPLITVDSDEDSLLISLFVIDNFGCEIERFQSITNNSSTLNALLFPNVFSPNNDNINPTFNVIIDEQNNPLELEVLEFKVYNRWGELLYNNETPSTGWNGTYKGEVVAPDVYAYFIEVGIRGCNNRMRKGNVTVIK